jgi:hypothetical protein
LNNILGIRPYALGGDDMGNYKHFPKLTVPGNHIISASAFFITPDGGGVPLALENRTVSFIVKE